MPVAITVNKSSFNSNQYVLTGIVVPSGSYATGGDPFNLATATYPVGQGPPPCTNAPSNVRIWSAKNQSTPQTVVNSYNYSPGATPTQANGTMQVFNGSAGTPGVAELAAGAYSASVLADTINFEATFDRL